jgi:hypothetical protein
MTTSIGFIFWGLLLVILDLNINQFDILPDFIGYILAAVGAGGLIGISGQFVIARNSCWALVALSILVMVVREPLGLFLGIIHLILNCVMMWFLLGGFMDLSISYKRPDLAVKASNRRNIYIVLMCIATLISFLAQEDHDIAALAIVAVVVAMLILVIMILHLIHQIKTVTEPKL